MYREISDLKVQTHFSEKVTYIFHFLVMILSCYANSLEKYNELLRIALQRIKLINSKEHKNKKMYKLTIK